VIAVLSDTHLPRGSRRLPARCVELLREASVIVHAGDIAAASALEELERFAPVAAVHGNVDEPPLRERLPQARVVEAEGLRIGVLHDGGSPAGRHDRLTARFPGCDIVVYGHSHLPEVRHANGVWILNPGSPTERRRARTHTMVVLRRGVPELIELD
jgi:uncharacterized protein